MKDPALPNPWGLTARQAAAMDALCTHGCHKLAARVLHVSHKTVEAHAHGAALKMPHRTPLLRLLAWDRWRRSTARPLQEWDEDMGPVLWWRFPVEEAPYCGHPNCDDWPGYHTHWTPLLVPEQPKPALG